MFFRDPAVAGVWRALSPPTRFWLCQQAGPPPSHRAMSAKIFLIPRIGVFGMRNDKKSGVLAQRCKRAYLCTKYASKRLFWIPRKGVFGMHSAKQVWFWRGAASVHISAPSMPTKVPRMGCLKCPMPKNKCGVLAWRSKGAYLCTKSA